MKIETTNALDGTINIDEVAKKVTVTYSTLRAAGFTSVVTIDSLSKPNVIEINITKVGSGTVNSVEVILSAIPSGAYGAVKITSLASGRVPNPITKISHPITF